MLDQSVEIADVEKEGSDVQSSTDSPRAEPHEISQPSHLGDDDGVRKGEMPPDGGRLRPVASSKPSVNSIRAVPDGGIVAWMQVMGSFFLFFNTWGIVNSFGTYQTYYETGILSASTPSAISWIGSIQAFLLMLGGSITGPIYDAGYVHHLIFTGSILIVVGLMMVSLCTQYWQVMLAQGIAVGLGSGCLFVPAVAILSTYFSSHVAVAMVSFKYYRDAHYMLTIC
nr:aspyridones efflux protein apdf [Quercus suber]